MKKIVAITLALGLALAFSGCAGKNGTADHSTDSKGEITKNNSDVGSTPGKNSIKGYVEIGSVDYIEEEIDGIRYRLYENKTAVIRYGELLGNETHVIPDTVNGYTVVGIAESAFSDGKAEGEFILPDTIQFIDKEAFFLSQNLTTVNLPANLEIVGESAFRSTGLKKIIIPDINIFNQLVFESCENLESVTIQAGNRIPDYSFRSCTNLKEIYLPEGIVEIGISAYDNCSISNLNLPSTLKVIDESAFSNNPIDEIVLPETLEVINGGNFTDTVAKNIPADIKIGFSNFSDQDLGDHFVASWDVNQLVEEKTEISEEDKIRGDKFPDNQIHNVVIPEGIKEVGADTFWGFENLTSVTLPSTLEVINDSAFRDCISLTEIVIPEGVTYIGGNAFSGCSNLKKVTLPSTLVELGFCAFENTALEDITIPDSVKKIGGLAFSSTKLVRAEIPAGVEVLEYGLFSSTESLMEVVIPEGVKRIETVFLSGTAVESIELPNSLEEIGETAFEFSNINYVVIPENVTSIGTKAFHPAMTVAVSEKSDLLNLMKHNPQYFWGEASY